MQTNREYQITDEELLEELKNRINDSRSAVVQLKELNKELKIANIRLQQSESLKSNFLSNVTNEMINPFSSILGLSKAIMTLNTTDTEKAKLLAQLIYKEAFNLDLQLKNIFAATKVEAGQAFLEINHVDVNSLLKSVVETYEDRHDGKQLTVNLKYFPSPELTDCFIFPTDAEMLKIIVANIISNSIKFSGSNCRIDINSGILNDELFISIKDYGQGIRPDLLNRIFDRFEKGNTEINSLNEGHGLGLSVLKAYLDILGGSVEITSEIDKGTLIIIVIPRPSDATIEGFATDGNEFLFEDVDNVIF